MNADSLSRNAVLIANRVPLEPTGIRESPDDDDLTETSSDSDASIDLDVFLRDPNDEEMGVTGRYEEDGQAG